MANCLVAQSGGPTTVINASLAGVVRANQLNPVYDHVYGGLNGIEGILEDRLYDLTNMSEYENRLLRQTPSSALGSCRYKLKRNDETDYRKLLRSWTSTISKFCSTSVEMTLWILSML